MAVDRTTDPAADASGGTIVQWPAYFYGPDGQQEIFQSAEQVPDGWEDHPSKVKDTPGVPHPAPTDEDEYDDLSDEEIRRRLKAANVSYEDGWPRDKLVSLLKAADDKAKGSR